MPTKLLRNNRLKPKRDPALRYIHERTPGLSPASLPSCMLRSTPRILAMRVFSENARKQSEITPTPTAIHHQTALTLAVPIMQPAETKSKMPPLLLSSHSSLRNLVRHLPHLIRPTRSESLTRLGRVQGHHNGSQQRSSLALARTTPSFRRLFKRAFKAGF
ncbi:hypothetical protein LIA77_01614 [Sarocladium implicatum]|nr:hypothetical protein LIA77_01614 [Sarocladium implicatum]